MSMDGTAERGETLAPLHPSVQRHLARFDYGHLPPPLAEVSARFQLLATWVAGNLTGDEVTWCLRDLLRAKDCAVRARVEEMNNAENQ